VGNRGPRLATDLQPRPVPQSTPPEPALVSAGFCVFKTEYWDQLPSLSSELKREDTTARFLRRASLWVSSRDTPFCLYREVSYPDLRARPAKSTVTSDKNVRNALQNIVKTERGKIAIHYTIDMAEQALSELWRKSSNES